MSLKVIMESTFYNTVNIAKNISVIILNNKKVLHYRMFMVQYLYIFQFKRYVCKTETESEYDKEGSLFPAGDHKAHINRGVQRHNKH